VIGCSLPPLVEMHVSYDDELKWISNHDDYYIDVVLAYSYACLIACEIHVVNFYSCIINMAKMFKVKY
jgi:hypothetical protein